MCWDTLTLGAYSIFDTLLKEARHFYLADLKFYLISSFPVNVKPSAFLSDEFYGTLEKMQKTN